VVLVIVLAVLLVMLLRLEQPADITQRGGETQAGIKPVFAMYGPGRGEQPLFDKPMAAAWGPGDRIYVADSRNNRIVVFDRSGRYLLQFGGFGIAKPPAGTKVTWKPGQLNYPTGVATDTNGDVYVADFNNDSISVFDDKGTFLRRFPDPYRPTGQGSTGRGNTGIAVTAVAVSRGKVYATDAYQVLVFDTQGKLLKQFGRPGRGPEALDHPNGIAVDDRGRIFVTDSNQSRVTAFTADGEVLWNTGGSITSLTTASPSPFVLPRGITILENHSILVADPLTHQLIKLNQDGALVLKYGDRGEEPGQVNFPNGVAARDGLILIADKENNRVQAVKLVGP
jgi:DNA-binding beta-propeller fold protein YncE